ncbi:MAG TPA: DeoR/GlpR family DNA-binding transcription regulator [Spirochaetia bacterium]|nr:DeoR/GlpR family DNA-binding transcription regulator [Spirochaetia bacterium]
MKDRAERIMDILARRGYQSVSELAAELQVSDMTVRRYLDQLEKRELIKRTHGGAFAGQEMIEVDYRIRETVHREVKEGIGAKAFSLIQPGESVFIDAGTTTALLAYAITDTKRITVVTHSLVVARALENRTNVQCLLLGGTVHGATHSVLGPLAEEAISQFRFNRAFLGTSAIDLNEGLSQSTFEEIPVKRKAASQAQQVVVLADSSKFDKHVTFLFMKLEEVNTIITDPGLSDTLAQGIRERGIELTIAAPTEGRGT